MRKPLVVPKGEIRFDAIGFNYGSVKGTPGADPKRVIDGMSLTIRAGEKVGLIGRSGAGKSTLVNLLLRFYNLEKGRILIDGQDIADVTQESLRASVGMVTQDTSLLHRSVLDNILYGRPDAGLEGAIEAAKRAHAHEFIIGLEDKDGRKGYDARVGERGVKLSGGQRQRIAIARVLLKDAPILILDEATSALEFGGRGGDPGAAPQPDGRQDRDRHRPPAVDDSRHGPAHRARSGPHHRGREPRGPAAPRRALCPALAAPVRRLHRGGGSVGAFSGESCPGLDPGGNRFAVENATTQMNWDMFRFQRNGTRLASAGHTLSDVALGLGQDRREIAGAAPPSRLRRRRPSSGGAIWRCRQMPRTSRRQHDHRHRCRHPGVGMEHHHERNRRQEAAQRNIDCCDSRGYRPNIAKVMPQVLISTSIVSTICGQPGFTTMFGAGEDRERHQRDRRADLERLVHGLAGTTRWRCAPRPPR